MIRMIMHGCNGAMGQTIAKIVEQEADIQIVAGVDLDTEEKNGFPVYPSLREVAAEADVVVD